jgi:predicted DNA binding CopG/RHH family protein
MKKLKRIPKFKNEKEEFEFWSTHDSTEYVDYSKGKKIAFPNLKPSVRTVSVRLPESMIAYLKILANKRDIPYQSLMKTFLTERIQKELRAVKKS